MHTDESEAGASAAEYALLVAGIAALIVTIVYALGLANQASYTDTCTTLRQQVEQQSC